jgi:glycosylphosphatidylinositol transamidase (GPIT) subunit GPI8
MQGQSDTELLFSDGGMFPAMLKELGASAEGLTGMTPAPDPTSGFADAYRARFGGAPPAYAANTYDAVLLLAYGLEQSNGKGGDRLADALIAVTSGRGAATSWDEAGVARALAMIHEGALPDIRGATGDLDFGDHDRIDIASSYYALWRVEGGAFRLEDFVSTDPDAHRDSAAAAALLREQGSTSLESALTAGSETAPVGARQGLWALIVAGSSGWENYRHQSDALAQYQLLRSEGVADDHIVLILADDIAEAVENPERGVVKHDAGGPNLAESVDLDYTLGAVSASDILDILAGRRSARLPEVIQSAAGDNVYVFMSGHGGIQGLFVGVDRAVDQVSTGSFLSPEALGKTIGEMQAAGRYRRVLIALEMCHGGVMGRALTAPGSLLISGANANENSLATNYAPDLDAWLADEFAVALTGSAERNPTQTLGQLYRDVYLHVPGSHVSVYNAANFGSLDAISLSEFVSP